MDENRIVDQTPQTDKPTTPFPPHREVDPYKISTMNKILSDFTYFARIFKEFKQKNGLYLFLQ